MLERVDAARWFCNTCSHDWPAASAAAPRRFASVDDLVARTGLRRDELVTLADVGALNSFGYDRRSALWQAERAVRPSGELFATINAESAELAEHDVVLGDIRARESTLERSARGPGEWGWGPTSSKEEADGHFLIRVGPHPHALADLRTPSASSPDTRPRGDAEAECPLRPMTEAERLVADYAGTGLTVGRHPMALRRDELAMRGVLRASDLRTARQGRRVRIAGMVITRQRPGTAKGFVFLTLEDETGIANIIVRPDLFARDRLVIVEEPFLIVEGVLQNQDGVTSVRAEHVQGMRGVDVDFDAHDFY